jgi:hypothetical protein
MLEQKLEKPNFLPLTRQSLEELAKDDFAYGLGRLLECKKNPDQATKKELSGKVENIYFAYNAKEAKNYPNSYVFITSSPSSPAEIFRTDNNGVPTSVGKDKSDNTKILELMKKYKKSHLKDINPRVHGNELREFWNKIEDFQHPNQLKIFAHKQEILGSISHRNIADTPLKKSADTKTNSAIVTAKRTLQTSKLEESLQQSDTMESVTRRFSKGSAA